MPLANVDTLSEPGPEQIFYFYIIMIINLIMMLFGPNLPFPVMSLWVLAWGLAMPPRPFRSRLA